MSARPGLCGGHWATGVPTAITNRPKSAVGFALRKRFHAIENTDDDGIVRTRKVQVSNVQCTKHAQSTMRHSQLRAFALAD